MSKKKFSLKDIPGWVVMLTIFGLLYITGYHTEAIGQFQRIMLVTGLRNAEVPEQKSADTDKVFSGDIVDEENLENEDLNFQTPSMAGANFQMVDLKNKKVKFSDLKGKVIFLNIWATWCPPCIAEMPNIQKLYEKVGSEKIAFVMLSVDSDGMEKVKKFVERKSYTFPVYMPAGNLPREFSSNVIPTTFIISPEGKIVSRHEGMADYDTKEMRDFLTGMLK
jgi:thiol-disulfide isomerase/thioredoxin